MTFTHAHLLGVKIDGCTVEELHQQIQLIIEANRHELVLNVNAYALTLAHKFAWFRTFFNQAAIVFPDGAGVVLAAELAGQHLPRRITYAEWMWELSAFAENKGYTLFFLGARPGIAEKAALNLKAKFPAIKIVGFHDGYFDQNKSSDENRMVIETINQLSPDILIVGFGMPRQERWLFENWSEIDAHVFLTGGAVFDYISGEVRRAPKWMTAHGFEWLGRLMIEPGRLWKRYLLGLPYFLFLVLKENFQKTMNRGQ